MQDEFRAKHIPIDLIRTIVSVAETGSLTKAAKRLGMSQPAVTAQLKKIEQLVGGTLFDKTQNGSVPSAMGRLILEEAKRILHAHDQIFRIGGGHITSPTVRLGMTSSFARRVLEAFPTTRFKNVALQADNSLTITEAFSGGFLDIAYVLENPGLNRDLMRYVDATRREDIVWIRARDFKSVPGQPVPILTWPGNDRMIPALQDSGLSYTIAFSSPDLHAIRAAAFAGIGLTLWPASMVPDRLVIDTGSYLPAMTPAETFLLANREFLDGAAIDLLDAMKDRFFKGDDVVHGEADPPGV